MKNKVLQKIKKQIDIASRVPPKPVQQNIVLPATNVPRPVQNVAAKADKVLPKPSRAAIIVLDNDKLEKELQRRLRRVRNAKPSSEEDRDSIGVSRQCISLFSRRPWIPEYSRTLVVFPGKVNTKYIVDDKSVETHNDMELYKPNMLFNILNCNVNSYKRSQNKDILTLYDENNATVKFIVVHELQSGRKVVQNQEIFADEKAWLAISNARRGERIDFMLNAQLGSDEKIDAAARQVVVATLSQAVGEDQLLNYIREVEGALFQHCVDNGLVIREYLSLGSGSILFLSPLYFGRYSETFRERFLAQMYKPQKVYTLSSAEMFPEIFLNINISNSHVDTVTNTIRVVRAELVMQMAGQTYTVLNPTERVQAIAGSDIGVKIDIPQKETGCQLDNTAVWETVSYVHNGVEYCYSIPQLVAQFSKGKYMNDKTKVRFRKKFVDEILSTFQEESVTVEIPDEVPVVVPVFENKGNELNGQMLAQLINSELTELETKLHELPESKRPKVCEYCKSFISSKDGISSVDADARVVSFCNVKCFSA